MEFTNCSFNFSYEANIDDFVKECAHLFDPLDVEESSYETTPEWIHDLVKVIYGICCCLGLPLNFLVIFMAIRCPQLPNLVRIIICMLSIAHITFLSTLPFLLVTTVYESWPFGTILCKCYFLITNIHHLVVPVLLAVLTFDRFLGECYPIIAERRENSLIYKLVPVSVFFNIPVFLYSHVLEINNKPNCNIFWPDDTDDILQTKHILGQFIFGFVIPLIGVLIFVFMGVSNDKNHSVGIENLQEKWPTNKRLKMLTILLCAAFFLCWAPYWAIQLVLVLLPYDMLHGLAVLVTFLFSGCLTYVNCVVCPVVYMIVVGSKCLRPFQDVSSNPDYNADGTTSNLQLSHANAEVDSNPLLSPRSHEDYGSNGRMDATTSV